MQAIYPCNRLDQVVLFQRFVDIRYQRFSVRSKPVSSLSTTMSIFSEVIFIEALYQVFGVSLFILTAYVVFPPLSDFPVWWPHRQPYYLHGYRVGSSPRQIEISQLRPDTFCT